MKAASTTPAAAAMRFRRLEARGGVPAAVARVNASQYLRLVQRPGRPPAWEARVGIDGEPRVISRSCRLWGSREALLQVATWLLAQLDAVVDAAVAEERLREIISAAMLQHPGDSPE